MITRRRAAAAAASTPESRQVTEFFSTRKRYVSPDGKTVVEELVKKENTPTKRQRRSSEERGDASDTIIRAKRCLGLGQVSYNIVGRDQEMNTMVSFISESVKGRKAASLYVSGMPGTGKTMCAKRTVEILRTQLDFCPIWVNCMNVDTIGQLYQRILEAIEGDKPRKRSRRTPGRITEKQMTELFATESRMIVLYLDEVDQLQKRIASFPSLPFHWPTLPGGSNVVLIGIANSCDLMDQSFEELDIKPRQLLFRPYGVEEVVAIVKERLIEHGDILDPQALELCARKCAAATGDLRKALETCTMAIERASTLKSDRPSTRCTSSDVLAALKEVHTPMKASSRYCGLTLQQRVLLASILSLSINGCKLLPIVKIYDEYSRICTRTHVPTVGSSEVHHLCTLLESNGLLRKPSKAGGTIRYMLNVEEKVAREVIKDDNLLSSLIGDKIHL